MLRVWLEAGYSMATVWVKPHFLEKDGQLENVVFMNICSWDFPDMFIRGGNLCS
jgi:hypothetical protein